MQALPSVQHFLRFAAIGHPLGQLQFFLLGQQGDLANLFQVHPHRVINAEALRHGVGVYDFFLRDLLNGLQRGVCPLRHLGNIILSRRVDAQIFQGVVDLVHLLRAQVQALPHVQKLRGGQAALLRAPLNHVCQLLRILHGQHGADGVVGVV